MPARSHASPLLRRLLAAGSVALVLLLAVLAACPELHRWLHSDADHDSHACAVALFASGVTLAAGAVAVAAPALVWHERPAVTVEEIFLAPPRYLRQPERGPPAC
jgi:zinc transporter ZupT